MPIKAVSAPEKSGKLFKDWVSKHKSGRPRTRAYAYEETLPHKVFHADLNDIISGKGLENARPVAWRHLHIDPKGNHALVEIRVGEKEDDHFLQEAHFGPLALEHRSLPYKLKKIEELKKEDFELCYLRMFAVKISAIWLRAAKRKDDYFIPFAPCFYGLAAGRLYSAPDFLKIAQGAVHTFYDRVQNQDANDLKGG